MSASKRNASSAEAAAPQDDSPALRLVPWPGFDEWEAAQDADPDDLVPGVDYSPAEVERRKWKKRAWRIADRELATEGWTPPDDEGSAAEQIERDSPHVEWFIPNAMFKGCNVLLTAQAKAGKTVLTLNVMRALLSGAPLFDAEQLRGAALAETENIVWFNAELTRDQALQWLVDCGLPLDRVFPVHLRGKEMAFDVPAVADWTAGYLRRHRCGVWFIDPKSALDPNDENDNTATRSWLRGIDSIKKRAHTHTALLVHHAGSEAAKNDDDTPHDQFLRPRGSTALEGWADMPWSYTGARHEQRWLTVYGRDADLKIGGLDYVEESRHLTWSGNTATPTEDARERLALRALDKVRENVGTGGPPLNAGELKAAIGGKAKHQAPAIAYAVRQGWLREEGTPNRKQYFIGDVTPYTVALVIGDRREDAE